MTGVGSPLGGAVHRNALAITIVLAGILLAACGGKPQTAKVEAARLEDVPGGGAKRIVLTDQAITRVGLQVAPLREEQITRRRAMGGEIVTQGGATAVRVRLSVSDFQAVDAAQPARVVPTSASSPAMGRNIVAQPLPLVSVAIPANPAAAAVLAIPVDFSLEGTDHGFTPAERVLVEVAMKGSGVRKTVPYSSLIYELNGDTSIYTSPEPRIFSRQRVVVDYIDGDKAVLSDGPAANTSVVVVGATELYGTEFRVGK